MEKLNIAEILKDCPTGMELDSALFEGLEFDCIVDNEYLPIRCRIKHPDGGYNVYNFTKYGCWLDTTFAKCVIFPKGKNTWEGFQRPFKNGDIVYMDFGDYNIIAILKKIHKEFYYYYVGLENGRELKITELKGNVGIYCTSYVKEITFATEYEKELLFNAIKDNGYRWDAETKTLEKLIVPKFKMGDKIKVKNRVSEFRIIDGVFDTFYSLQMFGKIDFTDQDNWELVPNKFDITTLKPFDKVLVRNTDNEKWKPTFWGFYDIDYGLNYPYECCGNAFAQCIPYESNEHLLGTTKDCDEHFKTWE